MYTINVLKFLIFIFFFHATLTTIVQQLQDEHKTTLNGRAKEKYTTTIFFSTKTYKMEKKNKNKKRSRFVFFCVFSSLLFIFNDIYL